MAKSMLFLSLLLALSAACCPGADKPIITVLDLTVDQVSVAEMKTLISLLSSALFQTGRYTVIDVSERDRILKEIEFSTSDCTDDSCQVEIGKLLSAELIVVGRLGMIGKRYVVSLKMLETSSSRTVSTADGTYKEIEAILDDLPNVARRIAGQKAAAQTAPGAGVAPARAAAVACAVSAVASAGLGAYFLTAGLRYLSGPAAEAFDAYMVEPQGSAAYDSLYQAYLEEFAVSRSRLVPAVAALGSAAILGGASVVLFALPRKAAAANPAVGAAIAPHTSGLLLGVRVSW
jgi:hypothetical protein